MHRRLWPAAQHGAKQRDLPPSAELSDAGSRSATDQGRAKYAPDHEPHHERVEHDQENGRVGA